MKLYLHIGMPRTGTTSLQKCLTQVKKIGKLDYPSLYKDEENIGHHLINNLIQKNPKDACKELFRQNRDKNDLIISCEALFNILTKDSKNNLVDFLYYLESSAGFEVEILCTIRPLLDYILSIYLQQVRSGYKIQNFDQYFEAACQATIEHLIGLSVLKSKYKVTVFNYHRKNNETIIDHIYGKDAISAKKFLTSNNSVAPSLLLHSFINWIDNSGFEISNKLRWELIGADIDGKFFDKNDNNFEELRDKQNKLTDDTLVSQLIEKYGKLGGIDELKLLLGSQAKVYNLTKYKSQDLDLARCQAYLKSMGNNADISQQEIMNIGQLLIDFKNFLIR